MPPATAVAERAPRPGAATRKLSRTIAPTTTEVMFDRNDIIVSKTDTKGMLIYVNQTFLDISGYVESELLGQPHSMIRHPDMPRCIFKLLWERLQSGKEIFAYVKNMTKSGDYYWVLAHATPSITTSDETVGYHSNRRVPERKAVDTVISLYRSLKEMEDRESDRRTGLERSWQHLNAMLQQKGVGYDEFVLGL